MKETELDKISLKKLNIFLKTYQAKSPLMVELKEDLEKVVSALNRVDSNSFVDSNRYIAGKYLIPPQLAFKYKLRRTTEGELASVGVIGQTMALHQIVHLLKDALEYETVLTKVSTALNEMAKEIVAYGFEKMKEHPITRSLSNLYV